jgi:hypothetical protein
LLLPRYGLLLRSLGLLLLASLPGTSGRLPPRLLRSLLAALRLRSRLFALLRLRLVLLSLRLLRTLRLLRSWLFGRLLSPLLRRSCSRLRSLLLWLSRLRLRRLRLGALRLRRPRPRLLLWPALLFFSRLGLPFLWLSPLRVPNRSGY